MSFQVGIDIGGSFTDCVAIHVDGRHGIGKARTRHEDLSEGVIEALEHAARTLELDVGDLLAETDHVFHGTTVGTNAMLERMGATVGVITTRGVGDTLLMMRAHGRVAGLPIERVIRTSQTFRPPPIVPRGLIEEVSERVDCMGNVVTGLSDAEVEEAALRLVHKGVDSIAICFLWSFVNQVHEHRAREVVEAVTDGLYLTCSSDLVPRWGEYERAAATAINCYVGPVVAGYVERLAERLDEAGYRRPLVILECAGGAMSSEQARAAPILTIDSGPAAGLSGAAVMARAVGGLDVICTDMGGTSFDVGLIVQGLPVTKSTKVISQYEYFAPTLDITSIGAGGGSYVWLDEMSGTLKVGPASAGSDPGPICYGLGGGEPTITDADLVLGFVDPDGFLGGSVRLDVAASERAFGELGAKVGMGAVEAAAGAVRIVDSRMADLIRQLTIAQGRDPRDFAVYAYGGAGPVHAYAFARELGCSELFIPLGNSSSVWSALGAALSDFLQVREISDIQMFPGKAERVNRNFARLEKEAIAAIKGESGRNGGEVELARYVDMRFRGQIFEVEMAFLEYPCTDVYLATLGARFSARYEDLYGKGAGFSGAGYEFVNFKVRATLRAGSFSLPKFEAAQVKRTAAASASMSREIYWPEVERWVRTDVHRGDDLRPGTELTGPCVIDLSHTAIVIGPGQTGRIDELGSVVIALGERT